MIKVKQFIQEFKEGSEGKLSYPTSDPKTIQSSSKAINNDKGLDRVEASLEEPVYSEVAFIIEGGDSEISISRQLMVNRSPYFRDLISSLDQSKVSNIICLNPSSK
jgi:hypothetical protein